MPPPVEQWTRFQRAGRDLYKTFQFAFALTTDVVSYYEYVDIRILCDDLRALIAIDKRHIELLRHFLNGIGRFTDVWGLPQSITASSILGNFYLSPVDAVLRRQPDVQFVRYSDDIKIFSNSREQLRLALRELTRVLRNRHLNLSVHKTKMLVGSDILAEFEDSTKAAIEYGIDMGSSMAEASLVDLFDRAVAENPVRVRDVRFALYRFAKTNNPHAVMWVLKHLPEIPYLAGLLLDYLVRFMPSNPAIENRIRDYLRTPTENIYPYAEFQYIRMLSRTDTIAPASLNVVWTILQDQNKPIFVRTHAARCVGKHAAAADSALLRALFKASQDPAMKRALLVAETEAAPKDAAWLGSVAKASSELAPTCTFLKSPVKLPLP
jgi:hypothetical protein